MHTFLWTASYVPASKTWSKCCLVCEQNRVRFWLLVLRFRMAIVKIRIFLALISEYKAAYAKLRRHGISLRHSVRLLLSHRVRTVPQGVVLPSLFLAFPKRFPTGCLVSRLHAKWKWFGIFSDAHFLHSSFSIRLSSRCSERTGISSFLFKKYCLLVLPPTIPIFC